MLEHASARLPGIDAELERLKAGTAVAGDLTGQMLTEAVVMVLRSSVLTMTPDRGHRSPRSRRTQRVRHQGQRHTRLPQTRQPNPQRGSRRMARYVTLTSQRRPLPGGDPPGRRNALDHDTSPRSANSGTVQSRVQHTDSIARWCEHLLDTRARPPQTRELSELGEQPFVSAVVCIPRRTKHSSNKHFQDRPSSAGLLWRVRER